MLLHKMLKEAFSGKIDISVMQKVKKALAETNSNLNTLAEICDGKNGNFIRYNS